MPAIDVLVQRRFKDLDPLGHVNNVAYLDYLQEARVRMLMEMGQMDVATFSQVIARQEINFKRPLFLALEPITVRIWVAEIGNSSYTIDYLVLDHDGTVAADARTVMVCFDAALGIPVRVPEHLREVLSGALVSA